MQDFLNKVGKTASAAANKAGNKASEMIEIGKVKSKISSQKQTINEAKRKIADYCYDQFKAGNIDDEKIKTFCEAIQECEAVITSLEKDIEDIKADYNIDEEDISEDE